jgi:capsular exopolysaccharide synthesis family protein
LGNQRVALWRRRHREHDKHSPRRTRSREPRPAAAALPAPASAPVPRQAPVPELTDPGSVPLQEAALDFVARRWRTVALAALIGLGAAAFTSPTGAPEFAAATRVFVEEPQRGALPVLADLALVRRAEMNRRLELVRSIPVADAAQRILDGTLAADPVDPAAAPAQASEALLRLHATCSPAALQARLQQPGHLARLLALRAGLQFQADPESSQIAIVARDADAAAAARRANAWASAYLQIARLRLSSRALGALARLAPLPNAAARALDRAIALQRAQGDAAAVRAEARAQRTIVAKLAELGREAAFDQPAELIIPGQLPLAPEPERGASVEDAAELDRDLAALETEPAGAGAPATDARARLASTADRVYARASLQHQRLAARLATATAGLHHIDPARPPSAPASAGVGEHLRRGAGAGAGVALLALILLEMCAATLAGPQAIARAARARLLGVVFSDRELRGRRHRAAVLMHESSKTPAAEAFRHLRTALRFGAPGSPRTLLVTSANTGEGKTTLAANLATSIAHLGERVLLIDADLRRPRLHELFGLDPSHGLSRTLTGSPADAEVQATAVPNLSVLCAGPALSGPAEYLSSARFRDALRELALAYDRVVIDSSPLAPVADAEIVAPSVDGVVLVVRDRRCTAAALDRSLERLHRVGAPLLGVVANDVHPAGAGYAYGYGRS